MAPVGFCQLGLLFRACLRWRAIAKGVSIGIEETAIKLKTLRAQ